jgi:signal transduction histidine kinase
MKYKQSIRQKITLGYYAIVVMIVGLSIFTFIELSYLEKKIMFGEAISEFFDTTLEIRRFEKNFFLYNKKPDHDETLEYVTRARKILEKNADGFAAVAAAGQIDRLGKDLGAYRELMRQYGLISFRMNGERRVETPAAKRIELEGRIRKTGKDIVTAAEDISKTERTSLQALLNSSRRVILFSILALSATAIIIGQILSKMVARPLAALEKSMELIAEGSSDAVQINSRDQEILSLTKAFNKMLKDLELQQRHLIQSEKLASLGTLLSGVAHELNNPLSNISSSGQILAEEFEGGDREHQKELIGQINEQTDRARNIVRSLLEFSRDKEFKKQALPLKALIEETIRFIRGQVPTGVIVTVTVPGDVTIHADKQRIQQAFLNLIKNALEAFSDGTGAISIKAEKRRAIDDIEDEKIGIYNYMKFRGKCTLDDDTVDIEIRDTGSGVPLDILPKIFDPFFTTKDVGKGSGLGLFIVHEIIEEHDGCIAVDSEPGKGTTFLIRLPVK